MNPLALAILALAVTQAPPARSTFSLERLPECGVDKHAPKCALAPLCKDPVLSCRPPHWSESLHTWVRYESRPGALKRYRAIAEAIADTAEGLVNCKGSKDSSCEELGWPDNARQLAIAALTVAIHESSLREDVESGRLRGASGEACLVQVMPKQAPRYASWLTPEQRDQIAKQPKEREAFAQTLVGSTPEALRRCFEIGMRMLARSRLACSRAPKGWDYGMFSMYGTGTSCSAPGIATSRLNMYRKLLQTVPRLSEKDARTLGIDTTPANKTPKTPPAARSDRTLAAVERRGHGALPTRASRRGELRLVPNQGRSCRDNRTALTHLPWGPDPPTCSLAA